MITPTNTIVERADHIHEIQDNQGRSLKFRLINALDRLRLLKAAGPDLAQNEAWLNMAALACSVTEINGIPRASPVNERQIEALVAELGDVGLQAVAERLNHELENSTMFDRPPEGNFPGTQN